MHLVRSLFFVGYFFIEGPPLVQAYSMGDFQDAFAKESDPGTEMMEDRPIARAILVHSPEEAAEQRGNPNPELDRPEFPSEKDPRHNGDINPIHVAQHESITRGLQEKSRKLCVQLLEQQRKLDRKIEDLMKAGKTENLDDFQSKSDKIHAFNAVYCNFPE